MLLKAPFAGPFRKKPTSGKRIETVRLEGISKSFQEVQANKNIHLTIRSGEILGLLGENGAGKSTLMNLLYGLYRPDTGRILINGEEVTFRSPRDALRKGIGMVHQHFMLVQNHTVLENLILGDEEAPFLFPQKKIEQKVIRFQEKYGLRVPLKAKVWQLSAGEQQRVEIVKALLQGADLLILDEPTSVLTPLEAKELWNILRTMASEGHGIVIISHKLEEILELCHQVVVLRKGEVVGSGPTFSLTKEDLARMMVGRKVVFSFDWKPEPPGEVALRVDDLVVRSDRGLIAVRNVSLEVRRREIVGIAGVAGNGQRELVEAITGLRKVEQGRIWILGKDITNQSARVIHAEGVAHIPEERIRFGTVPNLLIYENAVLKRHHFTPFSDVIFLDYDRIRAHAETLVEKFSVAASSIRVPIKHLSGGNIQKLIVGREVSAGPVLLVASHPTYGLDVGATEYIRQQLLKRREEGEAVLLVSEDLEEIVELSDRIAVMYAGEIVGIL
ncbi:MAG: ABC transporter ATP-binding protein, partial [Spirochaetales bacterium]